MGRNFLFTSESVTEGHPDKIADQISDAILDNILAEDPVARVAAETVVTTGMALVVGEISTTTYVDIPRTVRETIRAIGYTRAKMGFDADTVSVLTSIDEQSPDIAMGVNQALEIREGSDDARALIGAGDQGMVFGFACNETPELMPLPISLAHRLSYRLAEVRKSERVPFLWPDGKTQVTVRYENDKPVGIDTILISTQHQSSVSLQTVTEAVIEEVVKPVVAPHWDLSQTRILINPTGRFVIGGPHGDSGLTGRKIIVDTYGGYARHGGGAFSGKDPTKVDRSASYAARWVAKNLVAAQLADKAEIQIAYAIGVAQPISIMVDTFGTGRLPDDILADIVRQVFDLRPLGIIEDLDLRRPIYLQTAAYGHFGRTDVSLPWEQVNRVDALLAKAQVNPRR
ncbi:methionine adenosyltransferase [Sulfobacillus thermosulfidooxidans]|uniref:S-adenosylmethionine synthase n=1 Tax=Sulfobacillus thermosulfidooxidans (strain DSM 9293 / VKM B-1269 / AT-1) TaxID=929705 RepID=A0A1W1WGN0_SULTA|nr:methionine adenosyltransferase [Sulfobacillus thermosulfidooxidans]OLZ10655.1 methionine adenosyltransferase [Sulfobacillus thermosulfidooxidans]OLZ17546.1 methionine adenosyltransferase [Sulfobacillus thermosulfidooxidans]OLZ20890.1 methionine adenosyltransferase [Sulfobacillus thermosulfidooxidans]SMC05210.1 methionine adenosyltransferase [Sulfobacillus thermosulfidooxidans DSM 9293]